MIPIGRLNAKMPQQPQELNSAPLDRRKPTVQTPNKKSKAAEIAGGTAAGCAAVCCCCPCTVLNLLFLTVYKLPVSICKKIKRKRLEKKKKKKRAMLGEGVASRIELYKNGNVGTEKAIELPEKEEEEKEAVELEKEMRERFYGGGFWRSPSQRGDGV